MLVVLVPLRLDDGGFTPFAIGAVFLAAAWSRWSSTRCWAASPTAVAACSPSASPSPASIVVAVAFAAARDPYAVAVLTVLAAISFGAFYTPGIALVSDRAEAAGLSQAIGFGIMNTAWALGNMTGPSLAGVLAEAAGDAVPYALAAALCLLTLRATGTARAPTRVEWPRR